jgi:Sulfatase
MRVRADALGLLAPVTFAFAPVTAMILATKLVLLPVGSSIARMALVLAVIVTAAYSALRSRQSTIMASNVLAMPLLLAALYPGAYTLASGALPIPETIFAWVYLAVCVLSVPAVAGLGQHVARGMHDVLTIIAAIFVAFTMYVVGRAYWYPKPDPHPVAAVLDRLTAPLTLPSSVPRRPDVFHLVLDGMGRPDVLESRYGMTIDPLIEKFRALGFHLDDSIGHANYVQTHLSLSSMLNLTYLDDLTTLQGTTNHREPLRQLMWRARVPDAFKRLGYVVEFIGPGSRSEGAFQAADICDCPQLWFSEPEVGTLTLTPLKVVLASGLGQEGLFRRSLSVFKAFERERTSMAPRYVYAHVMLPHPPFVANEAGDFRNPHRQLGGADASFYPGSADEYRTGYRAQATFTLTRALEAATRVVDDARRQGRDVVVIVNGDHGPRLGMDARQPTPESGRFALPVLIAIHWPADLRPDLPPGSLVNVYRTVFRTAFGMNLPPLADRAYVSGFNTPYAVIPSAPFDGALPSIPGAGR